MPQAYVDKGDPYYTHCLETMRLLRERLELDETKLLLTFQSRFGRAQWLEPATDRTVKALAKEGVKNIAVITPGFSADCLETLEEIAFENAHIFKQHGGENFAAIPCLNDSAPGMLVIRQLALARARGLGVERKPSPLRTRRKSVAAHSVGSPPPCGEGLGVRGRGYLARYVRQA